MLCISIANDRQTKQYMHESGPLELGRGQRGQVPRLVLDDSFVSRDHMAVEELPSGRLRVTNLSQRQLLHLPGGRSLAYQVSQEIELPLNLQIGKTALTIERADADPFAGENYQTLARPIHRPADPRQLNVQDWGESPPPDKIASWLEAVLALQRSSATDREFYDQTARALVELVGLDLGMVLLRGGTDWQVGGHYTTSSTVGSRFSRTLLTHVASERRTFFQDLRGAALEADSLRDLDAVVASPFFGLQEEVAGVLYGTRIWRGSGGIRPLEAQLVQLLAGALGANLARTTAARTRVQFEQFL